MKKEILIVTYIDFWRGGAGHISRLLAILNYLRGRSTITIVYIGRCLDNDQKILETEYSDITVHFLDKNVNLDISGYVEKFAAFIADKYFDVVFLEYIEMYALLGFFPASTVKILDTHDLLVDKIASFKKFNLNYDGLNLDFDQELAIYSEFDHVVLINKKDYEVVAKSMGLKKLLLVPHPVKLSQREVRAKAKIIVYVASLYSPNVDAINWFLDNVWPSVSNGEVVLKIYGHVTKKIEDQDLAKKNVFLHGFVDDLSAVYDEADIVINPVRAGAGLKIKNVEALGNGLPLLTTAHGIAGIENAAQDALCVADNAEDFIATLNELINNYSLRKKLSECAFKYADMHFSESVCFKPLDDLLFKLN